MQIIVEIYSALLILLLNVFVGLSATVATEQVAHAKRYRAEVVSEIENSNFNPVVIQECIENAADAGYQLTVDGCIYDEEHNMQLAEVSLTYYYSMPIFGIGELRTTRGIAR